MIAKIFEFLRKAFATVERDRIDAKFDRIDANFDHMDSRLDGLEISHSEIRNRLQSIHEINLANNEAIEQKLNATKVGQEVLGGSIDMRFTYFDKAFDDLKSLIKSTMT